MIQSQKKIENKGYPENFYDADKTKLILHNLYTSEHKSPIIINGTPNVIFIVLESFSAKIIAPLGGMKNVTPHLNRLCREGVLFQNFYSSGSRTDKGLISILSGYPAQPKTSIITYTDKSKNLPKINQSFLDLGYTTSFIYGGNTNYANINSYLNMSLLDNIITEDDFQPNLANSKWGVQDQYVFDTAYHYLRNEKQPFFSTILTLSSHEPFDVPHTTAQFSKDTEEDLYLNAAHYTDQELGKFVANLKSSSFWKNSLLIITADHGARHPYNSMMHEKDRYHIPMLWIGGALTVKDTVINTYSSQTDLALTLLNQLDVKTNEYNYSKDMFSKTAKSFAFYAFNNGFGYINDTIQLVYDLNYKKVISTQEKNYDYSNNLFLEKVNPWDFYRDNIGLGMLDESNHSDILQNYDITNFSLNDTSQLHVAKAYMQSVFSDFNNK